MKTAVVGTGYVGLSFSVLLAQNHQVIALDIIEEKVEMINSRHSPISDPEIESYLQSKPNLNLKATLDPEEVQLNLEQIMLS